MWVEPTAVGYVLHRAIVRHVLIGQRDCKFVNDVTLFSFYVAVYFFHTSRLVSS